MRLAPIAIFYHSQYENLIKYAGESSRTTHASEECIDACKFFASLLAAAFFAKDKSALRQSLYQPTSKKVAAIASGSFLSKSYQQLIGSGYVIESLEAALWCFHHSDSFEQAILLAANMGNDADTTAAICGQIAGAFYGFDAIPEAWRTRLHECDEIAALAIELNALK